MKKRLIKDFDIESLMDELRTFTYTTEVDGEAVTVNVELFTHSQVPMATRLFLQTQGERVADQILHDYDKEEISASDLSGIIKTVCVERWKHFLEMWKINYNPIWNVDGTEKRTITTQYGKITTMAKGTKLTDEQKVNGTNSTQYGQKLTDEQKATASDSTKFGKVVTHTNPTTTGKVAAFDSLTFVNASETSMTNNSDTDSGSETRTSSMGTIEHSQSGTDTTTVNMGKLEHSASGQDTDTNSGSDTVTDTFTRGGNIGTTMTQQLLSAEESFWSKYSFFEHWFDDIAREIGLPIWG